jgi:hypothetical protein
MNNNPTNLNGSEPVNASDHQAPVPNGEAPDTRRAQANRANAQYSTGPRTEAGKHRSSLNALRHGLTGHTIVLPSEDLAAYERHTNRFFDDLKPKGAVEEQLAQIIVDTTWRLNRIAALETNLLTLGSADYAGVINTEHPEVHAALATASALRDQTRALATLSTHEHRLSRQFESTLKQLRELQAERRSIEEREIEKAADLVQVHEREGIPYDPANDGFVFSNDEIATHIHRRNRDHDAYHASFDRFAAS